MELETIHRATDGPPAIISLEPGWELLECDESLPMLLVVRVPMKGESESGIPESDEQYEAMESLVEALADSLQRRNGAKFIGVETCDGEHAFYFQMPSGKAPGPAIAEATKKTGAKTTSVDCTEDPEWETVLGEVLPDAFEVATSDAMMLMWTLEDEGKNLATPRPVRHTIMLPDDDSLQSFRGWAEPLGYRVSKGEGIADIGFYAHADRVQPVEFEAALGDIESMVEQALELEGAYVEWDCDHGSQQG
jgi:hypothetical protein